MVRMAVASNKERIERSRSELRKRQKLNIKREKKKKLTVPKTTPGTDPYMRKGPSFQGLSGRLQKLHVFTHAREARYRTSRCSGASGYSEIPRQNMYSKVTRTPTWNCVDPFSRLRFFRPANPGGDGIRQPRSTGPRRPVWPCLILSWLCLIKRGYTCSTSGSEGSALSVSYCSMSCAIPCCIAVSFSSRVPNGTRASAGPSEKSGPGQRMRKHIGRTTGIKSRTQKQGQWDTNHLSDPYLTLRSPVSRFVVSWTLDRPDEVLAVAS